MLLLKSKVFSGSRLALKVSSVFQELYFLLSPPGRASFSFWSLSKDTKYLQEHWHPPQFNIPLSNPTGLVNPFLFKITFKFFIIFTFTHMNPFLGSSVLHVSASSIPSLYEDLMSCALPRL
jgi:hypothetical protein